LIKEFNVQLDNKYTSQELSVANAYQRMTEEHLYWCVVWSRWIDPQNWETTKAEYFKTLGFLKVVVPAIAQRMVNKNLYTQGTGRYTPAEIQEKHRRDLQSIADFLGDKPYFLGDTPATIDATIFAFAAATINVPLKSTAKDWAQANAPNLTRYLERMHKMWDVEEVKKDDKKPEEKKQETKTEEKKEEKVVEVETKTEEKPPTEEETKSN